MKGLGANFHAIHSVERILISVAKPHVGQSFDVISLLSVRLRSIKVTNRSSGAAREVHRQAARIERVGKLSRIGRLVDSPLSANNARRVLTVVFTYIHACLEA